VKKHPGQIDGGYEDVSIAEVKDPENAADERETDGNQQIERTE
jgi:hypothetical protein